jgi:hypothetical protein
MGWLVGEQIPRGLSFAAGNNEPEALLMGGVRNLKSDNASLAITATTRIPEQALRPDF